MSLVLTSLSKILQIYHDSYFYIWVWLDFYQLNKNMIKIPNNMIFFLIQTCEAVTLLTSNLTNELYMFMLIFKDKNLAASKLENMYKSQK